MDPTGELSVLDWLSMTGQSVLEVTAGPVYTDRTHTLAAVRTLLAWYPPDVERYVLAAGWQRLCQSLPMVGRAAEAGDELGSRLLSAGLAGDLLWLAFALSRRWAPYAKWRGTAFRSLPAAARLGPLLDTAAAAPGWLERETALATACEVLLDIQREQGRPAPESAVIAFFDRPYRTVDQAVPPGTPRRHHRPRCRTAAAHGWLDRAVGRLHRRLVQPGTPGGPADGLPGLGRRRMTG